MQLARPLRRLAFFALVCAALVSATGVAAAALGRTSVTFGGAGTTIAGREISLKVTATSVAATPSETPDEIARIEVHSPSARFNGDSDSLSVCRARLPTNGDPATCPKSSRVGDGSVAGILGEPGKPADMYGALSLFKGKIRLFNYKPRGGEPARMLAVVTTSKPFRGQSINLVLPVSKDGVVRVDIPTRSKLPPLFRKSYSKQTKLVLTQFSARVIAPRKRSDRPFLALKVPGQMDSRITMTGR
ncbi:MAG: hypothetical protein HYX29_04150 [Solirubrobacterales bacterium]|nr:hypothetical protein [Solirubrobacterales bacterium]